jgi:hypothetical protein
MRTQRAAAPSRASSCRGKAVLSPGATSELPEHGGTHRFRDQQQIRTLTAFRDWSARGPAWRRSGAVLDGDDTWTINHGRCRGNRACARGLLRAVGPAGLEPTTPRCKRLEPVASTASNSRGVILSAGQRQAACRAVRRVSAIPNRSCTPCAHHKITFRAERMVAQSAEPDRSELSRCYAC